MNVIRFNKPCRLSVKLENRFYYKNKNSKCLEAVIKLFDNAL